jgi:hypothetical protein
MDFAYTVKSSLALDWHEIRYERLVAGFEQEMRGICAYLDLDWMASMGEGAHRVQAREHATPSTAQLSRGLVTSATAQWRSYESQLAPAMPLLKPWIERFGG